MTPCTKTPDSPNPAPTPMASNILGSRYW
ncbi:hypothetical protein D046_5878, partial [Vibrio parahaemolyticus V-223/04]